MAGHIFAHTSAFRILNEELTRDAIIHADFIWEKYGTFNTNIVHNLLIHDLFICFTLFDSSPISIRLSEYKMEKRGNCVSKAEFALEFPDFRNANISINRSSKNKRKASTWYTKSNLRYLWEDSSLTKIVGKTSTRLDEEGMAAEPLKEMIDTFYARIQSGSIITEAELVASKVIFYIDQLLREYPVLSDNGNLRNEARE